MDYQQARDVMLTRIPQQAAFTTAILRACGYLTEALRLDMLQALCADADEMINASTFPPLTITEQSRPLGVSKNVHDELCQAHQLLMTARDEYYRENIIPLIQDACRRFGMDE